MEERSGAAPAVVPPPAGRWRPRPGGHGHGPRRPSGRGKHAGLHGYRSPEFPLENMSAASPERCEHRNRKRLLLQSSSGLDITLRIRCKQVSGRALCNRRRWDGYEEALSPQLVLEENQVPLQTGMSVTIKI